MASISNNTAESITVITEFCGRHALHPEHEQVTRHKADRELQGRRRGFATLTIKDAQLRINWTKDEQQNRTN